MLTNKWSGKRYMGFIYISPWLIGFLIFQFYPLLASLMYSFMDYRMFTEPVFVGLKNYIYMVTRDDLFWHSLKVTFIYVFVSIPLKLGAALIIALLLNMKLKFINFFRTIFYIPSIMGGSVAIAILWKAMFMKEGYINSILSLFSISSVSWLGNPSFALYTLSILVVWQFGSSMVLFLAGLKQIPSDLYEAAKVDGASNIKMFFSITLPQLSPIIFFNLIMQIINTFQEFTGALVITDRGGPMNATYLYVLKIYDEGFRFFKMGYASSLSWVLFVIILAFTSMIFRSSSSWVYYEDGGK
ncbi:MAG: sugar ABC transporter permease [Candidatus Aminicenantes bacterium]|nr:sugar ABC transporter permease [Candidatus Aminicenantes bacterium]